MLTGYPDPPYRPSGDVASSPLAYAPADCRAAAGGPPAVELALDELDKAQEALRDQLAGLADRLTPALNPADRGIQAVPGGDPRPAGGPLAERIRGAAGRAMGLRAQVGDLLRRLEI